MIYDLRENYGIFCSVVIYPVVPKDVVMLRLIPTASHTLEDVAYTIKTFQGIKRKLTTMNILTKWLISAKYNTLITIISCSRGCLRNGNLFLLYS